jgi:hypothetical protein
MNPVDGPTRKRKQEVCVNVRLCHVQHKLLTNGGIIARRYPKSGSQEEERGKTGLYMIAHLCGVIVIRVMCRWNWNKKLKKQRKDQW